MAQLQSRNTRRRNVRLNTASRQWGLGAPRVTLRHNLSANSPEGHTSSLPSASASPRQGQPLRVLREKGAAEACTPGAVLASHVYHFLETYIQSQIVPVRCCSSPSAGQPPSKQTSSPAGGGREAETLSTRPSTAVPLPPFRPRFAPLLLACCFIVPHGRVRKTPRGWTGLQERVHT